MIVTSFLAIFLTLLIYGGLSWYICLLVAFMAAPVCGAVELFSRRGTDTLTVPLAAAAMIFPLICLFSYLGW